MIELETNPRNRVMLRLLYSGGLRVSELVQLHWKDISPRPHGGQLTIFGKGSKTRFVLLAPGAYAELLTLRRDRAEDEPVFVSRERDSKGTIVGNYRP